MNLKIHAIALCAFTASFSPTAPAAEAPREVHGSADAFAAPGMALAWAVLRGADDSTTMIVIRVVTDPAVYSDVAAMGSDPFTAQQQVMLASTGSGGGIDVRTPRANFSAFPRTELHFFTPGSAATGLPASLRVFYLGVPDTTPEFLDERKLEVYLRERIATVRRSPSP